MNYQKRYTVGEEFRYSEAPIIMVDESPQIPLQNGSHDINELIHMTKISYNDALKIIVGGISFAVMLFRFSIVVGNFDF
jgi:hypothetical protein